MQRSQSDAGKSRNKSVSGFSRIPSAAAASDATHDQAQVDQTPVVASKLLTERLSYVAASFHPPAHSKYEVLAFKLEESCAARDNTFGPVDIFAYREFARRLVEELEDSEKEGKHFVYSSKQAEIFISNAIFLLATFLVLHKKWSPRNAIRPFLVAHSRLHFQQIEDGQLQMELSIKDCIAGLEKANERDWISGFLKEDAPMRIRQVCNKFVISPRGASIFQRNLDLKECDVTAVVVTSETYDVDETAMEIKGIRFLSIVPPAMPSPDELAAFFRICDSERGVMLCGSLADETIALLIGAWIVKHHELTAAETIGYLSFLSPACILGPQERFLKDFEAALPLQLPSCVPMRAGSDAISEGATISRRRSSCASDELDFAPFGTRYKGPMPQLNRSESDDPGAVHRRPSSSSPGMPAARSRSCSDGNLLESLLSLQCRQPRMAEPSAEDGILPPRKLSCESIEAVSVHELLDLLNTPVAS